MSIWERFKRWRLSHRVNESDAPADSSTAMTRATGGDPDGGTPSTTGTGRSEEFVGRVAGDDSTDDTTNGTTNDTAKDTATDAAGTGESGAERRARHGKHRAGG
ncbi:hypothetical protein [Kribbella shirazensis]|uniref:Uncharacterized protein n=1 Tax=Kribbella shirazensis TaxID=1105143 RepID=A0A7X5VI07_9ACTN|nr:hypothetical protein [Kribbella shirazensis]NIK61599.1 hypothetical protein [Kribbella shirazensis]